MSKGVGAKTSAVEDFSQGEFFHLEGKRESTMANLIAYFSRRGENYFGGSIRSIDKGNTERVAEFVQKAVGGDLFEIKPAKAYPADYYECTDVAKEERRQKARPAIAETIDVSGYDTIFLGYPNWWGTCPMCVFTFLDGVDLAGKRIVPFCTNEGSGLGGSVRDLKRAYPQATVEQGLSIPGSQAASSERTVAAWAKRR